MSYNLGAYVGFAPWYSDHKLIYDYNEIKKRCILYAKALYKIKLYHCYNFLPDLNVPAL